MSAPNQRLLHTGSTQFKVGAWMRPATEARAAMISEIHLRNFRGFRDFVVPGLSGINVIVGDNGVGKTALLEAVFLALCTNPQKALLLRQWRGLDALFAGAPSRIVDSIYADLFRSMDISEPVSIELKGDGPEARSLTISRGKSSLLLRKDAKRADQAEIVSPIEFEWVDESETSHKASTKISNAGIEFESTDEALPSFFLYAANGPTSSMEVADLFSALRKRRRVKDFINIFTGAFPWIEDLSVETYGGSSVLHAAIHGTNTLMPLTTVSGAINRMAAILLSVASRQDGVVLVDEIENGIYFKNQHPLLKALVEMSRQYNCQLFLTTHSNEWLDALLEAAGDSFDDVTLYRMSRGDEQPNISRSGSKTFRAGLSSSGELR
ncbi:MAG: ATP/GTP-binding protein [Caulobacterales bacterium]